MSITKEGIGPEKLISELFNGIDPLDIAQAPDPHQTAQGQKTKDPWSGGQSRAQIVFKRRLEKNILQEFNMINLSRVQTALEEAALKPV
mmetsp:Transcript_23768/g.31821  ORF Transcript_23768/g.31821 Transcript_23768/m.31821 type:complete len:89 (-) Transcript_23768:70-336(-)|eukprot:CAMPEP_0185621788 /NCGR_PEP_ID=MMETSP0436-20130131/58558_1 /TAXON_ID=626734 ORGANISM="Favella taraikaensis, Strain Fe Narragansett Bay" /NCGR_SAMPLE_ID=MMETSP0436 /ASSEMBLY_ACC=CAM_ASM_000390 /LENGTH=88 /DNA_ID=CAMNT_0028263357 /DNA_START=972 /DNA_END=1238 /DNA_ORIENTATION=+